MAWQAVCIEASRYAIFNNRQMQPEGEFLIGDISAAATYERLPTVHREWQTAPMPVGAGFDIPMESYAFMYIARGRRECGNTVIVRLTQHTG